MLTSSLIDHNIPRLRPDDSVSKALQLISDFKLTHLPVVSDSKFLGLISEEDLSDAEDSGGTVEFLSKSFLAASVRADVHFLNAVSISIHNDSNVVAVVKDDDHFEGVISSRLLLKALGNFTGASETGGIVVLEMERSQFSISEISRMVEENDCTILHMNTTTDPETGMLSVTLHLSKNEINAVISSFERYDFNVAYYLGRGDEADDIRSNYKHLMNYLDL
jgi:CBS domain-containing protein